MWVYKVLWNGDKFFNAKEAKTKFNLAPSETRVWEVAYCLLHRTWHRLLNSRPKNYEVGEWVGTYREVEDSCILTFR